MTFHLQTDKNLPIPHPLSWDESAARGQLRQEQGKHPRDSSRVLDLDEDAAASLGAIRTNGNAPVRNFVLDTSPEKNR
jgi:hypothetical protein